MAAQGRREKPDYAIAAITTNHRDHLGVRRSTTPGTWLQDHKTEAEKRIRERRRKLI